MSLTLASGCNGFLFLKDTQVQSILLVQNINLYNIYDIYILKTKNQSLKTPIFFLIISSANRMQSSKNKTLLQILRMLVLSCLRTLPWSYLLISHKTSREMGQPVPPCDSLESYSFPCSFLLQCYKPRLSLLLGNWEKEGGSSFAFSSHQGVSRKLAASCL